MFKNRGKVNPNAVALGFPSHDQAHPCQNHNAPNNPTPRKTLRRFLNHAKRFWFRLNVINVFPPADELLGVVQVWSGNIRRPYDNKLMNSDQSLLTGEPSPRPFVFSGRVSVGWSSTRPLIRSTTVEFMRALEVTVMLLLKLPTRLVL